MVFKLEGRAQNNEAISMEILMKASLSNIIVDALPASTFVSLHHHLNLRKIAASNSFTQRFRC